MKNFKQIPLMIHTVTANTVKGGDLVVLGDLAGVAVADGNGTDLAAVQLQGVFELPKGATFTFTQGAKCYWDATNKVVTSTASGNKLIGFCWKDAVAADAIVEVGLNNGV